MYKSVLFFLFLIAGISLNAQTISGEELLGKAISYHDPEGNWNQFNGELFITMKTPKGADRDSHLKINLPEEYFYIKNSSPKDTITKEFTLQKEACTIAFCGSTAFTPEVAKKNRLTCKSANFYKNYYTYLFGLPMKLKDPGTTIYEKVEKKVFKGKEYLVLKVSYDEAVGKDVWFFYFDPKSYAMEVYQFFRSDKEGAIKLATGEYILLSETKVVNDIKMPKNRAWYFNKDDKYLGTDILK
jgi:hypothetical protein